MERFLSTYICKCMSLFYFFIEYVKSIIEMTTFLPFYVLFCVGLFFILMKRIAGYDRY